MKDAIGYQRVSTREQGRSGLGLAAQRHDIEAFGAREGFSVKTWYQDIQTGGGKDALLLGSKAVLEHIGMLPRKQPFAARGKLRPNDHGRQMDGNLLQGASLDKRLYRPIRRHALGVAHYVSCKSVHRTRVVGDQHFSDWFFSRQ